MDNNTISLSLFFDVSRTYVAVTKNQNGKHELLYINSSEHPFTDFENTHETNNTGKDELLKILNDIKYKIDEINVALPNNKFALTQIPFKVGITGNELTALLGLEIKYFYEDKKFNELNFILTPFFDNQNSEDYVFVTIFENTIKHSIQKLLADKGKVIKIIPGQFATLNSFIHNYPELSKKDSILLGMYEEELHINLLLKGKPATIYYKTHKDDNDLLQKSINETKNLIKEYNLNNYNIFAYGNLLTADILEKITISFEKTKVFRLNAFRKYSTELDERIQKYCSRTAHIYPACLGTSLPDFTEHILLIPDENN